ncbi:MAG: hypothetical protein KME59_08960 [Trichormus sp. ATA11-4-KO1]|nr:hypothetical protein [Trichormus sp. ATA11-4-KO1]
MTPSKQLALAPSVFSLANSNIFAESDPEKLVQGFLLATAIDVPGNRVTLCISMSCDRLKLENF